MLRNSRKMFAKVAILMAVAACATALAPAAEATTYHRHHGVLPSRQSSAFMYAPPPGDWYGYSPPYSYRYPAPGYPGSAQPWQAYQLPTDANGNVINPTDYQRGGTN
jgi:hypothetical protein